MLRGGDTKSGSMLRIQRSYWVVTGFDIQAAGSQAQGARFEGAHFAVVRDSEISGVTGPSGVVFHAGATDIGFLHNKAHDARGRVERVAGAGELRVEQCRGPRVPL